MPIVPVFIGSQANDGTGDPLRTAYDIINDNFDYLETIKATHSDVSTAVNTHANDGGHVPASGELEHVLTKTGAGATEYNWRPPKTGPKGDKGDTGSTGATGAGVPTGGNTGDTLQKDSDADYDYVWAPPVAGAWGTIAGTLSDQTDLQDELDAKVDLAGDVMTGNLVVDPADDSVPVMALKASIGAVTAQFQFHINNIMRGQLQSTTSNMQVMKRNSSANITSQMMLADNSIALRLTDNTQKYLFAESGLTLPVDATAAMQATTKQQVDASLEGKQAVENGFIDRTLSTISFTDGTLTFSIQPTGTDFEYFSGGTKYTSTGDTVVITDTEGMWFFYFDTSGTLIATQTFSDEIITTYALVALIYWDATNNTHITLAEERHGNQMDSMTHLYNHNTIGTRYGSGCQVADVDADGSGNDASAAQISIGGGSIWDEDIKIVLNAQAAPANIPILYRDGANGYWRKLAATDYIGSTAGSGRLAYNNWTGAVWEVAEHASNDFGCMHLYASNDIDDSFFFIMGQETYGTVGAARQGATSELLNLEVDGLPVVEYKSIATFILQTATTYTNAIKARVRVTDDGADYIDWRFVDVGAVLNVAGATTPVWGGIAGTLSDQTDLQTALDAKVDLAGDTMTGDLEIDKTASPGAWAGITFTSNTGGSINFIDTATAQRAVLNMAPTFTALAQVEADGSTIGSMLALYEASATFTIDTTVGYTFSATGLTLPANATAALQAVPLQQLNQGQTFNIIIQDTATHTPVSTDSADHRHPLYAIGVNSTITWNIAGTSGYVQGRAVSFVNRANTTTSFAAGAGHGITPPDGKIAAMTGVGKICTLVNMWDGYSIIYGELDDA